MKKFINHKFNTALNSTYQKVYEEELAIIADKWDDITPYGWEHFRGEAQEVAMTNESDVLRRHYGKPSQHQRIYGNLYNF